MPATYTVAAAREALQSSLRDLDAALKKARCGKIGRTKAEIASACDGMRPHIITLARNIREARENFDFFERLSSSPVRNGDAIIALVVRLIGPGPLPTEIEQSAREDDVSPAGCACKSVPIPKGLGTELRQAMRVRGHTFAAASSCMQGMDPKTLRRLVRENGSVHLDTINRAREYIGESLGKARRGFAIP